MKYIVLYRSNMKMRQIFFHEMENLYISQIKILVQIILRKFDILEVARIHGTIYIKKNDLSDTDQHNGVITNQEPDFLECEVKLSLGSILTNKASGGDGIPDELFKIIKEAVKVLDSICQQISKTEQWPQTWKGSSFIEITKKDSSKEYLISSKIVLVSQASKVILNILQMRLQQYMS